MADLTLVRSSSRNSAGGGGGSGRAGRERSSTLGRRKTMDNEGRKEGIIDEEDEDPDNGIVPEWMNAEDVQRSKLYDRFSDRKKKLIVALVAVSAFMAPFSSSAFLPAIPAISEDLNTTPTIIDITVAVYIFTIGAMPLAWAPYSGLYGRRPIYLCSLPIFALGSMGVALSDNLATLIVTRTIQGVGSSAVLSVGAGSIGDIYQRQERGTAMIFQALHMEQQTDASCIFHPGILIGPAIAPAIAGLLSEYVKGNYGWRVMQWILCGLGVIASVLCFLYFPETAHEIPIEGIIQARRKKRADEGLPTEPRWKSSLCSFVWLNPLAPLRLLLLPHILAISLNSAFVLLTTYAVLVPLTDTIHSNYGISNAAILGTFYLAQGKLYCAAGVGNAFASFCFTGRMADHTLKVWLKKRKGVYVPEDRLRATLLGGGLVLPCAVLALGWVIDLGSGKVGLAFTVILLFVNGVGLMMILTAANTYCVDVLQHRSSEVIAVNNFARYTLSAAASAFILPLIQAIGLGGANSFAAGLAWIGFGLVCATIRWGEAMRRLGEKWGGTASAGTNAAVIPKDEEKGEKGLEEAPVAPIVEAEAEVNNADK
ncbi:BZ3500_MvSof-1268-A1-R1_Chr1-3g01717 [Microbotryum saponariae]|uniref:BZ3500_MvSof-1268-A1-R1_Chr1-3g01717 protein n=1 Tax=Microbotryum saponariae TaxID=289078 RepID=A0A2X0KS33_9BASI|nr:BZ3500_MvSof-1268-A1-R1_Chr1-3g01717 [Microbotryum saponariae]SCZ94416.1 BZ3501_MvSof-1269-A2-R1_Chr1-3g01318 [Microbotryum saponariae]